MLCYVFRKPGEHDARHGKDEKPPADDGEPDKGEIAAARTTESVWCHDAPPDR